MKKNGQYVGVDEKYIPEDEKYVDNTLNDEIKGIVNEGIKSAKDYISDKDNQEKIKNTGKKGLKILKGIGIGYLAFIGFIFLIFIITFIFVFGNYIKMNNDGNKIINDTNNIIDNIKDNYSDYEILSFNNNLESYQGTNTGTNITNMLDKIVTSIKKYKEHPITVIYEDKSYTDTDDIISLKKEFDGLTNYEVDLDYDSNGFINKVTIIK